MTATTIRFPWHGHTALARLTPDGWAFPTDPRLEAHLNEQFPENPAGAAERLGGEVLDDAEPPSSP